MKSSSITSHLHRIALLSLIGGSLGGALISSAAESSPATLSAQESKALVAKAWDDAARAFAQLPDSLQAGNGSVAPLLRAVRTTYSDDLQDRGASVRKILSESKYFLFRQEAAGASALAELLHTPIEMKFTAIDGRVVDLAAMRGKVVLIDFRGITHCAACEAAEPRLQALYNQYHDKGFEIISISDDRLDDNEALESLRGHVEAYIAKHQLPWPTYFDGYGYTIFDRGMDDGTKNANPFFKRYNIGATPTYLLIKPDGTIDEDNYRRMNDWFTFLYIPGYVERRIEGYLTTK